MVFFSRLRRDAALYTVPKAVPAGQRGRGRPRTYGKQRISLLKRAGQKRGWQQVTCRQYGKEVVKTIKTFEATYKPAQGRIRVVLVKEAHGWLPYFCTDPTMTQAWPGRGPGSSGPGWSAARAPVSGRAADPSGTT